jgi:uncharacterized protein YbjT (DUF2867 family)
MKIVVIGGAGLIGSRLVEKLRSDGHEPVAVSAGAGADAFRGSRVVVDVSATPADHDAATLDFSSRSQLAAEAAAGVGHHVTLSALGSDRLAESGCFRARIAQEEVVRTGPVPYTILRATLPFELIGRIADASTDGHTVRLPHALVQPAAADDVASALADIAVGAPLNDTLELAGPETFHLDDLVRRVLTASDDPRHVTADVHARYFGAELDDRSLTPRDDARIASTRFEDWLSRSAPFQKPAHHRETEREFERCQS